MIVTRKALSRRTILRGMGATLALPLLDAMMPAMSVRLGRQPSTSRARALLATSAVGSPARRGA